MGLLQNNAFAVGAGFPGPQAERPIFSATFQDGRPVPYIQNSKGLLHFAKTHFSINFIKTILDKTNFLCYYMGVAKDSRCRKA